MSKRNLVIALSLGLALQGCYTYTPINVADVTPDMDIRAELTPAARDALADVLPGNDRTLDGTVIENGGNELLLQVEAVATQRGVRLETLDQRVRVDRAGIIEVEMRQRDQAKTYGLAALVVAGVATVVIIAIEAGGANDPGNLGPDGPVDALVPLFRIPIGW